MALKSTVFKAEIQVSDLDRGYYGTHALTIARHPSETDERMMVRVLAFALHADPMLRFGRGISSDDEPDLHLDDLTGQSLLCIEVGLPDVSRVRKACGVAREVVVYSYGRAAGIWWKQSEGDLARHNNLAIVALAPELTRDLAALATRNMQLQCTIQDGAGWFSDAKRSVEFSLGHLKRYSEGNYRR